MKTLTFNEGQFQAERIIKTEVDIIGVTEGIEVFAFRGISDFSMFALNEGEEWDDVPKTQLEILQETVDKLVLDSLGGV